MESLKSFKSSYLPIQNEEKETDNFLPSENDNQSRGPETFRPRAVVRTYFPWVFHLLLILAYTTVTLNLPKRVIIREPFDTPSDAPIEYETVQFFDDSKPQSPYFGPSNDKTDAAWEGLLTNGPGIVWIDEETAANLPQKTERVRDYDRQINPAVPGYIGDVEMFHQLHCLNRIRMLFYNHSRTDIYDDQRPEMREPHTMHCFEYLRQVIQCHGDVGIMSLGWDDDSMAYTAIFDTQKQCRRFDLIQDWVQQHQVLTFLPVKSEASTGGE